MRRVAIGAPWLKHPFVPADQAVRSRQCELKKSWRGRAPFAEHGPARARIPMRRVTTRGSGYAPFCSSSAVNSVGRCR